MKRLFLQFALAKPAYKSLAKASLCLFLMSMGAPAFAEDKESSEKEPAPSFSFSEERGLEPIEGPAPGQRQSSQKAQSAGPFEQDAKYLSSDDRAKTAEQERTAAKLQPVSSAPQSPSPDDRAKAAEQERTAAINKEAEDVPQNSLSEGFAPKGKEEEKSFFEDVSWFFQDKKTKHKIAIIPFPSYSRARGLRLGLRLFGYSSDKKGYYVSFAGSKYLSGPFSRWSMSYIKGRQSIFRAESFFIYDNHYENYYGEGMSAALSDLKKLYAHRFMADYKISYHPPGQSFYAGLGAQLFFRKERPSLQEGETYFDDELFLLLKALIGYDTRDSWKDPKTGAYHQLSLACKAIVAWPGAYCRGEGDLRFYLSPFKTLELSSVFKNSVLALRAFAGSSFLSPPSYSTAYSLGGSNSFQNINALRGFKENRFRGGKMYFAQAEIRAPLLGKYLGGVLFAEMGEIAEHEKNFKAWTADYGGGLRLALPPSYDMKIRLDIGLGKDRQQKTNYDVSLSFLEAF